MKTQTLTLDLAAVNLPSEARTRNAAAQPEAVSPQKRKGALMFILLWTLIYLSVSVAAFAQGDSNQTQALFKSDPIKDITPDEAMQQSLLGATVPMWPYKLDLCFGGGILPACIPYRGQIMGAAPAGNATTNIPTYVVPLIVQIGPYTFDPTAPDSCYAGKVPLDAVQKSPLFNNSGPFKWGSPQVNFGTTQYVDAFQRAEWYPWDAVDGGWHTLFQLHTTTTQTYHPSSAVVHFGSCTWLEIDFSALQSWIQTTLIKNLSNQGVGPTTFPVILMSNVVENAGGCCILGYHSAYSTSAMQAYAWAMFDTTGTFGASKNIMPLSHELAEAVNDPTGHNMVFGWGTACQSNFEVGDPLGGVLYPTISLNGYTYDPQELAMMPWFFHQGSGLGWTSNNGTFKGYSSLCETAVGGGGSIT